MYVTVFDGMKVDVKYVCTDLHGFNVIDNIFIAWKTVNSMVDVSIRMAFAFYCSITHDSNSFDNGNNAQ